METEKNKEKYVFIVEVGEDHDYHQIEFVSYEKETACKWIALNYPTYKLYEENDTLVQYRKPFDESKQWDRYWGEWANKSATIQKHKII